jgi:two-component system nitrate/nitrite sensor histidine kinase NarX
MHGFLERGETERLKKMIATNYKTLGDAYADVREAIDGLRHTFLGGDDLPNPNIRDWLLPVVNEFQESIDQDNLKISVTVDDEIFKLFPEAHAQLIRIVQEALSNIRKHANAGQVWINCRYLDHNLILEIIDDGVGFSSDSFSGPSHHGLRGMRERAELIGADFQIISLPEQGTSVKIRLPLSEQWMEAQES